MKKIILSFILIFALVGCASTGVKGEKAPTKGENKPEKITVMLDWVPNTNHTGLYVALEKGYYKEQGLDVNIIQPTEGGTTQLVATNKAQFGVSYQEDVTQARASDVPVVSIAAVIQHNTSGFASKKEANISRPRDFEGKRYGGWGSPTEEAVINAVMKNDNADAQKVEFINIGSSDFFTAINRDVDFAWIYYGWDGVEAERRNIPLNIIMLKDLDPALDYYTPVLITSEKMTQENPELVRRFMTATSKGYQFAIENPVEAANYLLKNSPESKKELVYKSQEWLSTRYKDDAPRWGEQKSATWENYARWMYEHKLLPKIIDTNKAFTNEFLPNN